MRVKIVGKQRLFEKAGVQPDGITVTGEYG